MRIGIDAGHDPGWPAGLQYIRNLVYVLRRLPVEQRPLLRLLPSTTETNSHVKDLADGRFVDLAEPARLSNIALTLRRVKRRFLQPLSGRILDAAYSKLDVTFPGFGRPLPGVPQVHWIPDFQHVHLPQFFRPQDLRLREERVARLSRSKGVLVFSSQDAKKDYARLHPHSVATARVWHFCTTITEREEGGRDPHEAFSLPPSYFYVANQFWAHKEHMTLFRALVLLREEGLFPTIACTGLMDDNRNPHYIQEVRNFLKEERLLDQVRLLGMLRRRDQVAVLRGCMAVVQPSLFEGWSTVVEDAKAVGTPIILSDIPVHLEQAPHSRFFTAGSERSLATSIQAAIEELPRANSLRELEAKPRHEKRRLHVALRFTEIMQDAINLGTDSAVDFVENSP